jgi:hypothetical protein
VICQGNFFENVPELHALYKRDHDREEPEKVQWHDARSALGLGQIRGTERLAVRSRDSTIAGGAAPAPMASSAISTNFIKAALE